jgi:hypothetical protein
VALSRTDFDSSLQRGAKILRPSIRIEGLAEERAGAHKVPFGEAPPGALGYRPKKVADVGSQRFAFPAQNG